MTKWRKRKSGNITGEMGQGSREKNKLEVRVKLRVKVSCAGPRQSNKTGSMGWGEDLAREIGEHELGSTRS